MSESHKCLTALGERIFLARRRAKMNQAQLARKAGISERTVVRIETGDGAVAIGRVLAAMAAAGVEVQEALSERAR